MSNNLTTIDGINGVFIESILKRVETLYANAEKVQQVQNFFKEQYFAGEIPLHKQYIIIIMLTWEISG